MVLEGAVHRPVRGEQAKQLGARVRLFRYIDIFSAFAFPKVAPKRSSSEKALKTSMYRKYTLCESVVLACSVACRAILVYSTGDDSTVVIMATCPVGCCV